MTAESSVPQASAAMPKTDGVVSGNQTLVVKKLAVLAWSAGTVRQIRKTAMAAMMTSTNAPAAADRPRKIRSPSRTAAAARSRTRAGSAAVPPPTARLLGVGCSSWVSSLSGRGAPRPSGTGRTLGGGRTALGLVTVRSVSQSAVRRSWRRRPAPWSGSPSGSGA